MGAQFVHDGGDRLGGLHGNASDELTGRRVAHVERLGTRGRQLIDTHEVLPDWWIATGVVGAVTASGRAFQPAWALANRPICRSAARVSGSQVC